MADKKKIDIHILSRVANEVVIRGFADNTADLYGETVISREKPIGHIALQKWQACYDQWFATAIISGKGFVFSLLFIEKNPDFVDEHRFAKAALKSINADFSALFDHPVNSAIDHILHSPGGTIYGVVMPNQSKYGMGVTWYDSARWIDELKKKETSDIVDLLPFIPIEA